MLRFVPIHLNRNTSESLKWLADEENKKALREFLELHGLDMNDVVEIDFTNQHFEPLVMERDSDGKPIVGEDGYSVKSERRTIKYKGKKPTFK